MSGLEKQLVFIYTIVCIVLVSAYLIISFSKKLREIQFRKEDWWKWLLVIGVFIPLFCVGIFFFFVTIYGIVDIFIKDDFVTKQIVVNIFNVVILYQIFVAFKDRKKEKASMSKLKDSKEAKGMLNQDTENKTSAKNPRSDTILLAREIINEAGKESGGWKETIDMFNQIISELIQEENIHRKTDLLLEGLDNFSELFAEAKSMPNVKNSAANLNVIVHLRLYLDCVLAIDNDIITVNEIYTLSKVTGGMRSDTHNFVKLMVKISDLLDRAIVYLFENLNTDSKDYYPILETKIRGYLNEYVDDNTGWNKI